jgi:hypothetical protein
MSRKLIALQIRDAALRILREQGKWESMRGGAKTLNTDYRDLKISHWSQFQRGPWLEKPPAHLAYRAAALGLGPPLQPLANGLDIWASKKVFSIECGNDGAVNVISFRHGAWEHILLDNGGIVPPKKSRG